MLNTPNPPPPPAHNKRFIAVVRVYTGTGVGVLWGLGWEGVVVRERLVPVP